jgi:tellurite resistance protein
VSTAPSISPLVDRLCARFPDRDDGLVVLTDLLVLIAAADTVIDDTEKRALAESMETMLSSHLAPRVLRSVVDESRARIRGVGPDVSADIIGRKLAARRAAEDGLRLAIFIAAVSEGISLVERQRIERVARAAGLPADRLDELMADPFAF